MAIQALIFPDTEGEITIKNKGWDHQHFLRVQKPLVVCGYCKSRKHQLGILSYDVDEDATHSIQIEFGPGWKQDPTTSIYQLTEYAKKRVRQGKAPKFHTGVRDKRGDYFELRVYAPRGVLSAEDLQSLALAPTERERAELVRTLGVHDVRLRPPAWTSSSLPVLVKCSNPRCGWVNEVVEPTPDLVESPATA